MVTKKKKKQIFNQTPATPFDLARGNKETQDSTPNKGTGFTTQPDPGGKAISLSDPEKGGQTTGLVLPDGRTLLGLSKADVAKLTQRFDDDLGEGKGVISGVAQGEALAQRKAEGLPTTDEEAARLGEEQGVFKDVTQPQLEAQSIFTAKGIREAEAAAQATNPLNGLRKQLKGVIPEGEDTPLRILFEGQRKMIDLIFDGAGRRIALVNAAKEIPGSVPFVGGAVQTLTRDPQKDVNEIKGSFEARNQLVANVAVDVLQEDMLAADGFRALNEHEKRVNEYLEEIRTQVILSPSLRTSELEDLEVDALELLEEIQGARGDIFEVSVGTNPDPERIAMKIERYKKLLKKV